MIVILLIAGYAAVIALVYGLIIAYVQCSKGRVYEADTPLYALCASLWPLVWLPLILYFASSWAEKYGLRLGNWCRKRKEKAK